MGFFLYYKTNVTFCCRTSVLSHVPSSMTTSGRHLLSASAGLDWLDCKKWWQTASNHQSKLSGRWTLVRVSRSMDYMSHPVKQISPLSCESQSLGHQPVFKKTDYVVCSRVWHEPSRSTSACGATTQMSSVLMPPLFVSTVEGWN